MRTRAAIILTIAAATLLAACGGDDDDTSTNPTPSSSTSDEPTDSYPTEPITLIVPYPAGSGPDSSARTLAQVMEGDLGQRIIIQNVEGGNGTIGLSELAAADPDGYTISWMASPSLTMQWQRIDTPFEGPDTVEPIAQIVNVVSVLFAQSGAGLDSVDALVERAKQAPGEIKVGLPGEGSQQDIALRQLEEAAGIELDRIYFGAGEQVAAVVSGTVDVGVAQSAPVVQYVERGDLTWVGVFGSQQPTGIDAPLFTDSGYPVGYEAYEGLVAPAGTPGSIVDRLAAAAEAAVGSAEFTTFIESSYGAAGYVGPDELKAKITQDTATSSELIEKFGLTSS